MDHRCVHHHFNKNWWTRHKSAFLMNMQDPKYWQKSKSMSSLGLNHFARFAMRYPGILKIDYPKACANITGATPPYHYLLGLVVAHGSQLSSRRLPFSFLNYRRVIQSLRIWETLTKTTTNCTFSNFSLVFAERAKYQPRI